jgi:hypothetical protein
VPSGAAFERREIAAPTLFVPWQVMQKDAIIKRREVQRVLTERNIMLKLKEHPFLAKLRYAFQTEVGLGVGAGGRALFAVMWCPSRALTADRIGTVNPNPTAL